MWGKGISESAGELLNYKPSKEVIKIISNMYEQIVGCQIFNRYINKIIDLWKKEKLNIPDFFQIPIGGRAKYSHCRRDLYHMKDKIPPEVGISNDRQSLVFYKGRHHFADLCNMATTHIPIFYLI
jgi:hypothetical protein